MPENPTYKLTEIVGTSKKSYADATSNAIRKASKTLRNISWFEIKEMRGHVADGKVDEFQVRVVLGFRLED